MTLTSAFGLRPNCGQCTHSVHDMFKNVSPKNTSKVLKSAVYRLISLLGSKSCRAILNILVTPFWVLVSANGLDCFKRVHGDDETLAKL